MSGTTESRESVILKVASQIAMAEGKIFFSGTTTGPNIERDYALKLIAEVVDAFEGKAREKSAS